MLRAAGYEVRKASDHAFSDQVSLLSGKTVEMIFDVGCNQGEMIGHYRRLFPRANIHGFEPLPDVAARAQDAYSKDLKIKIYETALSNVTGEVIFNRNAAADSSSLLSTDESVLPENYKVMNKTVETFSVKSETIDNFCLQNRIDKIDILKIDAQGAELFILQGAERMLREKRIRLIYCEVYFLPFYKDQPLFEDIMGFLSGHKYKFVFPYGLVFGSKTGRLQWGDAIFIVPGITCEKGSWITEGS